MATESLNTWNEIRDGASDVERMIGQKQYNLAMIRARQTLELMVKSLCERYKLSGADLSEKIDALYKNRIITKTTAEHYHKIRMIGNRAAHEGDDNATGANTAYHLLSQELYTFANDFNSRRPAGRSGRSGSSKRTRGNSFFGGLNWELIFKIMIPVVVVVLIIALILVLNPKKKEKVEETESEMQTTVATMAETMPPVIEPPTTEAPEPETTKPPTYWVTTTDGLRVRTEPNTECDYVATLDQGTVVDYVGEYDGDWVIINFDGVERYVAKQYLLEKEGTPEGEGAEEAPAE